jgi:hypothetical protein
VGEVAAPDEFRKRKCAKYRWQIEATEVGLCHSIQGARYCLKDPYGEEYS